MIYLPQVWEVFVYCSICSHNRVPDKKKPAEGSAGIAIY